MTNIHNDLNLQQTFFTSIEYQQFTLTKIKNLWKGKEL